jgi:hypothetical protein
LIGL